MEKLPSLQPICLPTVQLDLDQTASGGAVQPNLNEDSLAARCSSGNRRGGAGLYPHHFAEAHVDDGSLRSADRRNVIL
jgi:hypothetical protein